MAGDVVLLFPGVVDGNVTLCPLVVDATEAFVIFFGVGVKVVVTVVDIKLDVVEAFIVLVLVPCKEAWAFSATKNNNRV